MHKVIEICLFVFLMLCNQFSWSQSVLDITPLQGTVLPESINKGQTANAYYLVKNNTSQFLHNNFVRYLPPNVEQVVEEKIHKNVCGFSFDLAEKQSSGQPDRDVKDWCLLQLKVSGAVDANDPETTHHLTICQDNSNCSGISIKENELNVNEGQANSLARLAIVLQHFKDKSIKEIFYHSTDAGVSWSSNNVQNSNGIIRSITCEEQDNLKCIAVGDAYGRDSYGSNATFYAYTSSDGGKNWIKHSLGKHGGSSSLNAVTCNGNYCVAVGVYQRYKNQGVSSPIAYTSVDGGNSWSPNYPKALGIHGSRLRAISCGGEMGQVCTAVGDFNSNGTGGPNTTFLSYSSNDGGMSWSDQIIDVLPGTSSLKSISCNKITGRECMAVGKEVITPEKTYPIAYKTMDGGINWSISELPKAEIGGSLNSIFCEGDPLRCFAVGVAYKPVSPIVYKTNDGGINWSTHKYGGCIGGRNSQNKNFNICNQSFKNVTCSNNGKYCTILGIGKNTTENQIVPIIFNSTDNGNIWLPWHYPYGKGFNSTDDSIPSIETIGINLDSIQ